MAKFSGDKIIVIFTVISAALLQLIDTSIVNVSLTQMMGNLGATFEEIGWVITGYAVSNVIMITLSGWMSNRFGRKYYFAGSIILFTIASVLCGMSTNVWELVAFRIIQGIGGGGLLSTAQAILIETFPKEEIGLANAIYGMGVIIGPALGPTLGGYITDNMSWQWVFYINVPFGILATVLTLMYVKEPLAKARSSKMDWFALAMLIAAIGSLQIVLEKGQSEDWFEARYITILAVVAVVAGIVFVVRELMKETPIVNLRLFNNRSFATGTLFNFVLGFGLYGTTLVIPVFCQGLLGFTAMQTGLIMLPGSIATAIMMPIIGGLLKKKYVHPAIYAGFGLILFFVFSFQMGQLNTQIGADDFFWPLIVRGLAMGLIFIPLTTISLANLKGTEIPQGTALSNMVRQLGGSIGIAMITTYISTDTYRHYADLNNSVNAIQPETLDRVKMLSNAFVSKGYDAVSATKGAYSIIARSIYNQATFLTYRDLFIYLGVFFLILIPLLVMFKEKKKKLQQHDQVMEWDVE
ncbi:MAG: DHA2 family efflux MFS transporter permease subunit [Chitinophagaceae bacterium]|nr:DHA2 family efflux MFS transporter permease subunit [Chitinophagaceae bacterium]